MERNDGSFATSFDDASGCAVLVNELNSAGAASVGKATIDKQTKENLPGLQRQNWIKDATCDGTAEAGGVSCFCQYIKGEPTEGIPGAAPAGQDPDKNCCGGGGACGFAWCESTGGCERYADCPAADSTDTFTDPTEPAGPAEDNKVPIIDVPEPTMDMEPTDPATDTTEPMEPTDPDTLAVKDGETLNINEDTTGLPSNINNEAGGTVVFGGN